MATLGRAVIDKNNCKEITDVVDAFVDLSAALGDPAPNPGPGPDGTAPTDYEIPWVPAGAGQAVKMIGGLAIGVVSGADFTIDNIINYTSGFTAPTAPVSVVNRIGFSCADNYPVLAVFRPDNSTWEVWTDTSTGGGGGTTYTAGFGLELAADEFTVDNNGYAGSGNELFGAASGTVIWKTVEVWLETLSGFNSALEQLLGSDDGVMKWDITENWLELLADYDSTTDDAQVIGHYESNNPKWFGMASIALGQANGAVTSANATFSGDTFTSLCGQAPDSSETVTNHFGFDIDDNGKILVIKMWNSNTWYCVQAQCPA
jgi:hypothetical protein